MKKVIVLFFALMGVMPNYAQSSKEMLEEIEGKWYPDGNGDALFTRTVELQGHTKQELFGKALQYYKDHYGNIRSAIQTIDAEQGIIIRKAIFDDTYSAYSKMKTKMDAWHIMTIKVSDNVVELSIVLTEYETPTTGYDHQDDTALIINRKSKVRENYPVNPDANQKTLKPFYKSYKMTLEAFDAIEKGLKN